ncbi:Coq4 family protein [Novosphingobium sp. 9]|uniref:Coq4 family protein n=1 Tax=Novosphingobium sp. 9 TaxID=2025349 RepID=UPI0021B5F3EE|nr:Coq4 family protein [Novosphingobium sp. 9]
MRDANDTAQVFRIMRALNAGTAKRGYERLLQTERGGLIAYQRVELAERFADPVFRNSFMPGSLGAAYADFLQETGYSAQGLADISRQDDAGRDAMHPYAWFGRRTRDVHDIWHILTGYRADEPAGEACLVAFSYAQTGGLGWAVIALASAFKAGRTPGGKPAVRAIWEGYRHGKRAVWLLGEDYEALLAEPLEAVRDRLCIRPPKAYQAFRESLPSTV